MIPPNTQPPTPPPKNRSYHSGWDYFTPEPGKWAGPEYCRACNTEMDVRRGLEGPTSSIEAMAGSKHKHDTFSCPHAGEDWHNQLIQLKEEYAKTSSPSVCSMIETEIEQVLATHKVIPKNKKY